MFLIESYLSDEVVMKRPRIPRSPSWMYWGKT